jgi:hypothetical protein
VSAPASRRTSGGFSPQLTHDGESHPVMRIGSGPEETAKRWSAVPPLSGISTLGAPRPGAQVLAVARVPEGVAPAGRGAAIRPGSFDDLRG